MPPSAKLYSLSEIDEEDDILNISSGFEVGEDGEVLLGSDEDIGLNDSFICTRSGSANLNAFSGYSLADEDDAPLLDLDEGEGVETPYEFVNLLDSLLYGCVGCEPCAGTLNRPKEGILKKGNSKGYGAQTLNGRSVSFSSCDIKTFNMTLGNNPCAVSGPPVMLDWDAKPTFERVVSLDEYESSRSPRRKRSQLKLSYRDRKGILEGQRGFTSEEVNQAWAEAIKVRQQRHETLQRGLLMNTLDDAWESAQRKCYRVAEAVGIA
jgi:hypothetical protein